jgi:SAM-dependent methyltransferase
MPDAPTPATKPAAAAGDLAAAASFWDAQVEAPDPESRHWLASPLAARLVNRRLTGRPEVYPLAALGETLAGHLPVERALSIGCGTGSLEREAVRSGIAAAIDGIDVSAAAIARARELARQEPGLDMRVVYYQKSAAAWLAAASPGRYQLIFFHGSLHHVADLEAVLAGCAAQLRGSPAGWLYLDEYIGPSRHLWCDADLAPARQLFRRVPPELRRTPQLNQPMDAGDPSEMVRAAELEPALRVWFEVESYRPYYGNILYPLLSAIRGDAFEHPAVESLIAEAAAQEEALAAAGSLRPLFATFLARPRSVADAAARSAAWVPRQDLGEPGGTARPAAARVGFVDRAPLPGYETELGLRQLLAERTAELGALYGEIEQLNRLRQKMESTRVWRLHDWIERHVRVPLRRRGARRTAKEGSSR